MSRVMADLCQLLQVKQLRTSVYHPQTDGLVERFNKTQKQMLRRVIAEDGRDWDLMIPYVLFRVREIPQASTGFTPFELLFGRQPRGLLDVAREAWENQPNQNRSLVEHVRNMRERNDRVMPLVREHLVTAQRAQQRLYNRPAQAPGVPARGPCHGLGPDSCLKIPGHLARALHRSGAGGSSHLSGSPARKTMGRINLPRKLTKKVDGTA